MVCVFEGKHWRLGDASATRQSLHIVIRRTSRLGASRCVESRAESVYWMGRYLERAENVARFIDVSVAISLGEENTEAQWAPLIFASGDDRYFKELYGRSTATTCCGS